MIEEIGMPRRDESAGTTRRTLLQAVVGGAGAVAVIGLGVRDAHAAKVAQTAVSYSMEPNGTHICKSCNLFVAPNACKQVDGVINPTGHCKIGVWKD